MSRPPLTIAEAAQVLGVSDKTVRRMLASGQLSEHSRDAGGRILVTPESIDATAVRMGRKVTAREEVREIAPALNANAEASLAAVNTLASLVQGLNDRIFALQTELAEARAQQKYLPNPDRIRELEAENAQLRSQLANLGQTQVQTPIHPTDQPSNGILGGILRRFRGRG